MMQGPVSAAKLQLTKAPAIAVAWSERRHQPTVLLLLHPPHPPFLTTDLDSKSIDIQI